ncbi:hypothetical protein THAOC_07802 [Thalassiosira oceanica]|uniref:Uncharacterized protein n=1 Tax=Thalassiosira oceanica TaxID=159749 RepID=K0TBK6_THAOC|nr:hypothetical protein THAOC_07802 [Thalassiosira oceanica]|eukprot:EJK70811.1 hypothetical protein THAOC_07802 [Thalassiosira oceanica]
MWLECCGVADERGSISELKGMLEQFLSRAKAKASEKRPSCASKLEPPSKRTKTVTHRLVAYEKGGERQENQDAAATRAYKKWTEEEDERLKELVRGFGSERVRWAQLATEMPGRDFRRCEERWMRIDPSISQSPFTAEEDRAIVRFQANEDKAGKWAELAKSLPGRTRKQIRDRWRNTISKAASEPRQSTPSANAGLSQRKTPTEMATMATAEVVHKKGVPQEKNDVAATKKMNYWTDEEDERLIELVRGFGSGPKKWKQLAAEMPGREGKRCQERWLRIRPFTAEEDLAIFRFQANKDKAGKWAELAESLPGRTVGQIKKRWNWKQSAPSANADRDGAKIFEA